ncbi:MAG: site-2 protease family protein, partial [Candidatus Sumerlaeota bacterium]
LKAGDMIVAINDQPVATWAKMSEILRENPNEQITLTVRRGEGEDERLMLLTTMLERDDEEQQGRLGVYYTPPPGKGPREGEPIHKALWKAPMRTLQLTDLIVYETVSVFTRSPREIKRNVGGPIVIGIMAYREAQRGLYHYLKLFAMICIILSIMNLLPIPILDGGYIAITLVEGIIGRPLPRKVIEPLLTIFFILFMLLFGWIFFNDIMNWVVKQ